MMEGFYYAVYKGVNPADFRCLECEDMILYRNGGRCLRSNKKYVNMHCIENYAPAWCRYRFEGWGWMN